MIRGERKQESFSTGSWVRFKAMNKTIAQLFLEKLEKLTTQEREVLLLAIKWETTPIFTSNTDGENIRLMNS